MPGEFSPFESNLPNYPEQPVEEHDATPGNKQERVIESLILRVSQLYQGVEKLERQEVFPCDVQDLIQELCLAQQTLLEERRDSLHVQPEANLANDGKPYTHRREVLAHLETAMKLINKRTLRTIEGKSEPE